MGIMLDRPDQNGAYFMLSQLGALKLEIKGLRHSSGRSISKHIRETYKLECGRKKTDVLDAFQVYLLDRGVLQPQSLRDGELIHLYVKFAIDNKRLAESLLAEYDRRGWRNKRGQTTAKYRKALMAAQR